MAASSPRGLLRRGAGLCLATMMSSRGARVAAWTSVVGSSRRVRGALLWARSAQVLHISLVRLVVKVGAVSCLRVWPSGGMCHRGFYAAVCGLASRLELYGEVGVARSRQPVMMMTLATSRRMPFFFAALCPMSVARLAGGAHITWVELYRF